MALEKFEKQPSEEFYIYGSILNVQDETEVINLATSQVTAKDLSDGSDATSIVLNTATKKLADDPDGEYTDNMLGVLCQAGGDGKKYQVTFLMPTSAGQIFEVDVQMKVKEL